MAIQSLLHVQEIMLLEHSLHYMTKIGSILIKKLFQKNILNGT